MPYHGQLTDAVFVLFCSWAVSIYGRCGNFVRKRVSALWRPTCRGRSDAVAGFCCKRNTRRVSACALRVASFRKEARRRRTEHGGDSICRGGTRISTGHPGRRSCGCKWCPVGRTGSSSSCDVSWFLEVRLSSNRRIRRERVHAETLRDLWVAGKQFREVTPRPCG